MYRLGRSVIAPFFAVGPSAQSFTHGSAWFSSEQGKKGHVKVGQLADLAVLSADFFSVEEEAIKWIESVLTVVGGPCGVHAHRHETARLSRVPVSDFQGFWGGVRLLVFCFLSAPSS